MPRQPASVAGDDLPSLAHDAFDQVIVDQAQSLGDPRDTTKVLLPQAVAQAVDHPRIAFGGRGDAAVHGAQLDPLLGDLGDVRVRLQFTGQRVHLVKGIQVVDRDHGVQAHSQVGRLDPLQPAKSLHRPREIARHVADLVVALGNAVQAEVDDQLAVWATACDVDHAIGDLHVQQTVGGDVYDRWAAVHIRALA